MPVVSGDPFGGGASGKGVTPAEVNAFHDNADTDSSAKAAHHTLGPRPNQAAPGDHKHAQGKTLTGARGGNVALTNLIAMLAPLLGFTDSTTP